MIKFNKIIYNKIIVFKLLYFVFKRWNVDKILLLKTEYRKRINALRMPGLNTFLFALCLCVSVVKTFGDVHYASLDGKNVPPFGSWENAATNIQDAVYAAIIGDTVIVSDGVYYVSSEIRVTNHITVVSLSGAENTIIDAGFPANSNRCFNLDYNFFNPLGVVDGFTMQNGCSDSGGGIACGGKAVVKNCIIKNNLATGSPGAGGGFSLDFLGTISNCVIIGNSASDGGGGDNSNGSVVQNCIISNNIATYFGGGGLSPGWNGYVYDCKIIDNVATGVNGKGGGITFYGNDGIVENCLIEGNLARKGGGVAFFDDNCLLSKCIVISNTALETAGGIFFYQHSGGGNVRNCLIVYNREEKIGEIAGGIGGDSYATIDSCTVAKNYEVGIDLAGGGLLRNTIIAYNQYGNAYLSGSNSKYVYTCMPGGPPASQNGGGHLDAFPQFVDLANGDFRLKESSPCIARGTNMDWMIGATDLAGNERIFDYRVDIGCYETIPEGFTLLLEFTSLACLFFMRRR